MVKQLTGGMLVLGAKQGCIGYLARLRIKLKHLSVQFGKSEVKWDKGRAWEAASSCSTGGSKHSSVSTTVLPQGEWEKTNWIGVLSLHIFLFLLTVAWGRIINEFLCKKLSCLNQPVVTSTGSVFWKGQRVCDVGRLNRFPGRWWKQGFD